jgi:hypothetical protein
MRLLIAFVTGTIYGNEHPEAMVGSSLMIRSKILYAFMVIAAAGIFQACTKIEDDRPAMERIQMTTEYLDVLGKYNAVAREFSRAVKPLQETEKRMDATFDKEWWGKYDEQWAKTTAAMNDLKNYGYRFEPFKVMQPDFVKFISRLEEYNDKAARMRKSAREWTPERKKELYDALDPLYADILKQSKDIVQKIDDIYNRVFVFGEKKQ